MDNIKKLFKLLSLVLSISLLSASLIPSTYAQEHSLNFGKFKKGHSRKGVRYPFVLHHRKRVSQNKLRSNLEEVIERYESKLKKSNLSEDDIVWLSLVLKSSIEKFQFTIKYYYEEEVDDQTRESEAEKFFNHDFNIRINDYLALHRDFRPDSEKLKDVRKLCTELFTSIFNKALTWMDYDLCFSNEILSVYLQRFINVTCGDHTFEAPFFNEHPKKLFGDF